MGLPQLGAEGLSGVLAMEAVNVTGSARAGAGHPALARSSAQQGIKQLKVKVAHGWQQMTMLKAEVSNNGSR